MTTLKEKPAILGGAPCITTDPGDMFNWPIVTAEDEQAVVDVLRQGKCSATDITKEFEEDMRRYMGVEHALACCNGTAALMEAMWACGVGAGDEIICPSMTYWASATPALNLGATVNFCDIQPDTLNIDPADIEHRIGPRTKAIMVVHYAAYPADMDPIMEIARKHGVKVIEDASHAQGSLYKGRMCGTIGDIGAFSMMMGKSLAIGEGGMIVTDNRELYERCVAYGHYERTGVVSSYNPADNQITDQDLSKFAGLPLGGVKHRINQTCSAMGRVQLKYYPERIVEIQKAMNRFWDLLEGVPGVKAHRPPAEAGSTMGGWYHARGIYRSDELGGLGVRKYCDAVNAERAEDVGGPRIGPGANRILHLYPLFHEADIFNQGKPTAIAFGQRDVRQGPGTLPVSESINDIALGVPWFKHDRPEIIEQWATAFRKAAENAGQLLEQASDE